MSNILTKSNLAHPFLTVKSLPPNIEAIILDTYTRKIGRQAREDLAQGEFDVLESCRTALGWRTVTSLAVKYYPLFPARHCWKRALSMCLRYRSRWYTKSLSIRYLLKAVLQQVMESLDRNFSGKLRDILNSTYTPYITKVDTILNGKGVWGKTAKIPSDDPDKYIKGRYGHMVRR